MKKTPRWLFFLTRTFFALAAAWVTLVLGLSWRYVEGLIHPYCPQASTEQAGMQLVTIVQEDGSHFLGWWQSPANGAVVVLLGGHGANRDAMLYEARLLARSGYGVLTFDTPACYGKPSTVGMSEVESLEAALNFVRRQTGVEWVGVLGFSAGGVTAIRGGAALTGIDAVIAEGNYYNLWGEIANSGAPPLSLEWQIERGVGLIFWLRTGIWPGSISPIDDLPKISPRPVFLIHGADEVDFTLGREQFQAAREPRALWIVPGVGHGGYGQAWPAEYEARLLRFLATARSGK